MVKKEDSKSVPVEGNFIELFPVRSHFKGKGNNHLAETIKISRGEVTIRHQSRLFTAFDLDVMLAAFYFCQKSGQRSFPATLADFVKVMGISAGKGKVMVRESLDELAASPVKFKECWYDAKGRQYVSESALSFIAYKMVTRKGITNNKLSVKQIRDKSWVEIPKIFYDSLKAGYFKYVDLETYFALPTGLTRLCFLYIEKRLGRARAYCENIRTLLENILKRDIKAQDIKDFKRRIIPRLADIFKIEINNKNILVVSRAGRQRLLFFQPHRKKLSSHGEYVLDRACEYCGRADSYFKNVVRKYIFLLGEDRVDGALGETRDSVCVDRSRYFIHMLKTIYMEEKTGKVE